MKGESRSESIPLSRALTAGVASAGSLTIDQEIKFLADALRPQSVAFRAGASLFISKGNASIPKITTGATASWLTETGLLSESAVVVGLNSFTPLRVASLVSVSGQLFSQSPEIAIAGLRRDLVAALGYALDVGVFSGLGASGEPLGLLNSPGLGSVTFGAAATRAKLASFEKTLGDAFGEQGDLAWVSSNATREKLRIADSFSGGGLPLWSDEDRILGKSAFASPAVPNSDSRMIFGNFSDLAIVMFAGGAVQLLVDPYSGKKSGTIDIMATLFADCGPIRPGSFVVSVDSAAQ